VRVVRQFVITGTSFCPGAWSLIEQLRPGMPLITKREPNNKYDPDAIAIYWGSRKLVYVPNAARDAQGNRAGLAHELAPLMDSGVEFLCTKSKSLSQYPGVIQANKATLVFAYEDGKDDRPTAA
jgi:hypothetical protein